MESTLHPSLDEACGSQPMKHLVATIEKAFPKATVELEASLSTQAVAGITSFESRERAEVESGRVVSRELRVGGE